MPRTLPPSTTRPRSRPRMLGPLVYGVAGSLLLAACAGVEMTAAEQEIANTLGTEAFQPATRDLRDSIETQDLLSQATFWSREYQLNPGDLEAAIKLAATVRKMGNPGRAVEITQTTRALYPKDPYLAAEHAAALVASEKGAQALPIVERALSTAPGYARLWSLRGAALDQVEDYPKARASYQKALSITPYDPNILANLGLSFALEGDSKTAQTWLERAAAIPGASDGVKRNLDLVRQLNGQPPATRRAAEAPASATRPNLPASPASAPRGRFQVFSQDQAQDTRAAARQMGRSAPVLQASDPDALARLRQNASPLTRMPTRPQAPHPLMSQGMAQPPQPGQPVRAPTVVPQAVPQQVLPPQGYPQGYAPGYPQAAPAQTQPQGLRRGPQRARR